MTSAPPYFHSTFNAVFFAGQEAQGERLYRAVRRHNHRREDQNEQSCQKQPQGQARGHRCNSGTGPLVLVGILYQCLVLLCIRNFGVTEHLEF